MKHRSVAAVIILSIITFGIYALVWFVKTKNEMNRVGANIPTAWWLIVPIGNIWWQWKYCEGVETVSRGKLSGAVSFLLIFLLSVIGMAIVQTTFNEVTDSPEIPKAQVV